jgi:hypothetical protein
LCWTGHLLSLLFYIKVCGLLLLLRDIIRLLAPKKDAHNR